MANLSISISNSIRSFGPAPTTKWGTGTPYSMTWGTAKWGEGTEDLAIDFVKLMGEALTVTGADLTLTRDLLMSWADNLVMDSETTNEALLDGSGWNYVFISQVTDADSRAPAQSYAAGSAQGTSYTAATPNITNWS